MCFMYGKGRAIGWGRGEANFMELWAIGNGDGVRKGRIGGRGADLAEYAEADDAFIDRLR